MNADCYGRRSAPTRTPVAFEQIIGTDYQRPLNGVLTMRHRRVVRPIILLASMLLGGPHLKGHGSEGNLPAINQDIRLAPCVDERVEVLSIVFRLAGNSEYNMDRLKSYATDIDRYFSPYRH